MQTRLITLSVPLQASPQALRQAIEAELSRQGKPLRWAVTAVEGTRAQVEAVVTVEAV
jgi:hypothetical protein